MQVGVNIRKIRELKGIKQEELASMLGITQTAYSKIERNETDLTLPRLSQIAKSLGVKEEDILFWDSTLIFTKNNTHNNLNPGLIYQGGSTRAEKELYEKLLASKDQEIATLKKTLSFLEQKLQK